MPQPGVDAYEIIRRGAADAMIAGGKVGNEHARGHPVRESPCGEAGSDEIGIVAV